MKIKPTDIDGLDVPTLSSGTYTPTLTNVTNVSDSAALQCQYLRVGDVVTVSGGFNIDPTLAATVTRLGISLPVASNLGAITDCGGTAAGGTAVGDGGGIYADTTNDRAQLEYVSVDTSNHTFLFSFTYSVI